MKIEVGEYVRTNKGRIAKLEDIDIEPNKKWYWFDSTIYYNYEDDINFLEEEEIEKYIKAHSKNIIDLIEVGDYVNGCEVMNIYKPRDIWEPIEIEINSKCTRCFLEGEIKTILTHEIYEREAYKIE